MPTTDYLFAILRELNGSAGLIADEEADKLVEGILRADKIFVAGAGRSGLMGRAFAMRLVHLGLQAYVVGETVTPGLAAGDLLIVGSGSGETRSLAVMAEKAKSLKARVAAATINPESTIGRVADIVVKLPGSPKEQEDRADKTVQPMGSLFEQMLLLFYDAVILSLMEKRGMSSTDMYGRHANLE